MVAIVVIQLCRAFISLIIIYLIKAGTSTNRSDQTNKHFIYARSIFSDFGIGLAYKIEDIVIDINSYSYGTGGFSLCNWSVSSTIN